MALDTWAIVELMGHSKIAGKISEHTMGGAVLLRVDVPPINGHDAYTRMYGVSAVYCITPTDEATAQAAARAFNVPPISPYVFRFETPQLEAKVSDYSDDHHDDDDFERTYDDPDDIDDDEF